MTPPRDRAIHILNQYDSFTWVPADPGISKSPDYVLLASVVGGELLEIDEVKFTTIFCFCGDGDRSACSRRLTSSSPFGAFGGPEDPGWSERWVADGK